MSLARRLEGPASLKLVLRDALPNMEAAAEAALAELNRLGETSHALKPDLVEQVC